MTSIIVQGTYRYSSGIVNSTRGVADIYEGLYYPYYYSHFTTLGHYHRSIFTYKTACIELSYSRDIHQY